MKVHTTAEVAALLETARRNIQNYCRRHNLPKFGREYMISDGDIEDMTEELWSIERATDRRPGRKKRIAEEQR